MSNFGNFTSESYNVCQIDKPVTTNHMHLMGIKAATNVYSVYGLGKIIWIMSMKQKLFSKIPESLTECPQNFVIGAV